MEIRHARVLGLCFGVRRALELAEAMRHSSTPLATLGPLVHNAQETARLEQAGIRIIKHPDEAISGTVVIRAHGERPEVLQAFTQRQIHIIDATCPFVKKSQRIARHYAQQGYTVVIVGHPDHPEVQGILGYVSSPAYVISNPDEVMLLPVDIHPGVIAQTTIQEQVFFAVLEVIATRYPGYVAQNTVCSATRERQDAAHELASEVDAMLVIGGRHSSNTNRLAEICRKSCPNTYLIETADEIYLSMLQGVAVMGITAGASTPNWLVDEVIARLKTFTI